MKGMVIEGPFKKKVMEKDHKYEYFLKVCVTFTWAYNIINNGHAY